MERTEEYLGNGVPCLAVIDDEGNTPLMTAAAAGQAETLKRLMQYNPIWMTDQNAAGETRCIWRSKVVMPRPLVW